MGARHPALLNMDASTHADSVRQCRPSASVVGQEKAADAAVPVSEDDVSAITHLPVGDRGVRRPPQDNPRHETGRRHARKCRESQQQ